MNPITDFVKDKLYPALFGCVDRAFPEMKFQKYRGGWASPYKLSGERSHDGRKEKSRVTTKVPHRIMEQGGGSKDLITFYKERHNLSKDIDAIKELADICGLELPPMEDEEGYRLWQEKQEKAERIASQMEEALYTDEGAATLNYLKAERGYSDEFIRWAGFGFVSSSLLRDLRELFQDGTTFPYGVGSSHTLAIPFRMGGDIKGFIFRTINPDHKPKYLYLFLTKGASQKFYLFGLTGLKLTGDGERDRDITIVEGQIDALRASFAGLPNVVAAGGVEVSPEALKEAKARGVKRVTLLLDADKAGIENTDKAIGTIQAEGLGCYVASLPSDGAKMDVDLYLRDHTPEDLKKIVDEAFPASRWQFYRLAEQEKYSGEQGLSPKLLEDYKRDVIAICNSRYTSPTDRDIILREASESTQGYITREALQEEADLLKLDEDKNRQKNKTIALTSEAFQLANNGSIEEAISLMKEKLPGLTQAATEEEFIKDLELPTLEDLRKRRRERPTGLKTGYSFEGKFYEYPFILPSGGLTLICGQTSHGKSRMLENLALQIAQNGEEGSVIYFTFEEDEVAVEIQMLNIYANIEITSEGNNLYTLNEYYSGSTQYFKAGTLEEFKRKEASFDKLLTSGKLRILAKYNDATKLANAIRSYSKNTKVKAVFVDYVQLMRLTGTRALNRKDELRDVCEILKDVAKDTRLPIVLAAQLNRSAASPVDMSCQNLADAADIEHAANVVMLLWNSAVKPKAKEGNTYYTDRAKGTLSPEAQRLEKMGFEMGRPGKLYAVLDKNRGGERYVDAVLDFDMNTGYIKPNYSQEPKQGKIFENGF